MENQPYLSVIIPAYKEGERIGRNLLEIEQYFKDKDYTWEVLVIVDGSKDNTAKIARNYKGHVTNLRVIDNPENHGKGYVVRQGLLEAKGKYRLFMDADGSTAITHLDKFFPEFEKDYDVIIGSRDIEGAFCSNSSSQIQRNFGRYGKLGN